MANRPSNLFSALALKAIQEKTWMKWIVLVAVFMVCDEVAIVAFCANVLVYLVTS